MGESFQPSKHSVQSVSKIEVNTLNPHTENQNSFHSDTNPLRFYVCPAKFIDGRVKYLIFDKDGDKDEEDFRKCHSKEKLKKKAYLKKNKTGPSDEEIEMGDTLRNTNITDFSWTLGSPKKEVLSSDEGPVQKNWGFAEDLEDTLNTPPRRIGVRPNFEDDEDVLL
ncbi:unnamed protein product [Mytilus coruscus]|uniref:Uncharacterized protein n=1 Tax=Mytilus coruscus TaxID=42192 RepID=A0A6J8E420_MYTCO|nr:unnamed protein product [Mytilus coruscus]